MRPEHRGDNTDLARPLTPELGVRATGAAGLADLRFTCSGERRRRRRKKRKI
jgi:hypothetical protein